MHLNILCLICIVCVVPEVILNLTVMHGFTQFALNIH